MLSLVLILAVTLTLPNSQAFFVHRGSFSSTPSSWVKNSLKILRRPPRARVEKLVVVDHDVVDGSHPQPPLRRQRVVDANSVLFFASTLPQDQDDKTDISNDGEYNVIVKIKRNLPNISTFKAKETWNKFVWRDSTKRMILWPFWLQEEQQRENDMDNDDDDKQEDIITIHSQVVNLGALQWKLPQQHAPSQSLVSFAPCSAAIAGDASPSSSISSGCHLTWQVQLAAKHPQVVHALASFWMTATVEDWMDATIATPRLLHRQVVISKVATVDTVVNAWLDFVWIQGGGLPLPFPPIQLPSTKKSSNNQSQDEEHADDDDDSRGRCSRRIIAPPGLSESILSITHHPPGAKHRWTMIRYQVDNPGIFTFAVHTHQGLVHFSETTTTDGEESQPSVQLYWLVEIRPIRQLAWLVEAFTESVVTTLARNLAVHLSATPFGSGMVQVSPPRGQGKSFASVRKDSWLGGVLEAHLRDDRSTWQQTLSILQPWTWGRATDESLLKPGLLKDAHTVWSSGNLNETMTALTGSSGKAGHSLPN